MKKLISEKIFIDWVYESKERLSDIVERINQRHEEAMKQRAWEAWKVMSPFDSETNRTRFEEWYNEKYGSDERIDN